MIRILLGLCIVSLIISCDDTKQRKFPIYGNYEYLRFERIGEDSKIFEVYTTSDPYTFEFHIMQINSHDTSILFDVPIDNSNKSTFNCLTRTLDAESQINGDFKQPSLPTIKSWRYFYVIKLGAKIEITNPILRSQLSFLENIVEEKLIAKQPISKLSNNIYEKTYTLY